MSHPCNCSFVPPHVTDHLAKRAPDDVRAAARATSLAAKSIRSRRAERGVTMDAMLAGSNERSLGPAAAPQGSGGREVWDCQQSWAQRVDLTRGEGEAATGDDDTDTVYDFAGEVRDFLSKQLERDSIDNRGMKLVLNVHFGVSYMNAFWDGDEMTFGDGDGDIFSGFARSLDVVAHELAHGVTQFTANLDYFSQSGALNEHFSDVFGTVVTQLANGETAAEADWLIGDEIMGPTLFGEALRSMRAPGTAYDNPLMGTDPQPAHMDDYFAGPEDNQGVHINSGIPNRAFYLAATDMGDVTEAGRIWYHGLQNLWPTAMFNDAAEVLVNSARVLVKTGEAPKGAPQTVRAAFRAVGVTI